MMQKQFQTPAQVVAFIGPDHIGARLDVSLNRVQRAAKQSQLPASWKLALELMAGQPLPYCLFSFKGV
jgi:hypothetical protein